MKPGRNEPCPCGSGKKYKKCCGPSEDAQSSAPEPMETGNVQALLQSALQCHQLGKLDEAEVLYLKVLEKAPRQADALHLLGLIRHQRGDYAEAERLIREAINRDPKAAFFYLNLGNALKEQGRADEAMEQFRKAIRLEPGLVEAHYNLANEMQLKEQLEEAVASYKTAIRLKPDFAEAYYNMGNALKDLDLTDEAVTAFGNALSLNPGYAEAHYNLGIVFDRIRRYDDSIAHYKQAIRIRPEYPDACYNLADMLREQEKPEEAEFYFRRMLELKPNSAEAYNGLSIVLRQQGRIEKALESGLKALDIQPDLASACNNLCITFREDGQTEQALEYCRRALTIHPGFAEAEWNRAMALLQSGDLAQGWNKYEWRFLIPNAVRRFFPQPRWDGSPLKGKTLLIHAEQGIGDQIMFSSMTGEAAAQCEKCIVECDARLVPLFRRSFPAADIIPVVSEPENFSSYGSHAIDFRVAMGSLPFFLRKGLRDFPRPNAYLSADHQGTAIWRERLSALGAGLKVGISWRGGGETSVRRMRSTTLDQWSGLFALEGVHFINLQYGECSAELLEAKEKFGVEIHHWEEIDPLKDLDGFASAVSALDVVISVDNSTVHMSGALGVPTWVLLPRGCDWRWMNGVEDTPWYSSLRLFRQPNHGQWKDVFERLAGALRAFAESGLAPEISTGKSYLDMASGIQPNLVQPGCIRRSYSGRTYTCGVITPVGPGHDRLYDRCLASVKNAFAMHKGNFSEIVPIRIDDPEGKLGRSRARNMGVSRAADLGVDRVFFLDADDEMVPMAFEYVSPYLDGYDGIWGAIWSDEKDDRRQKERPGQLPFLQDIEDVLSCNPFVSLQIGHFIKTSAALSEPFDVTMNTAEDFDYYLRIWDRYECIKIPLPFFYNWRGQRSEGPKSATSLDWNREVGKMIDKYRRTRITITRQ